jgi:hypothetical protein
VGLSWGKQAFQLTASSQLAENLAWGRAELLHYGKSTQAERRPEAEWRLRSLVTKFRGVEQRERFRSITRAETDLLPSLSALAALTTCL